MPSAVTEVLTQSGRFAFRFLEGLAALCYGLFLPNYASEIRAESDAQLAPIVGWALIGVGGFVALREW